MKVTRVQFYGYTQFPVIEDFHSKKAAEKAAKEWDKQGDRYYADVYEWDYEWDIG